MIIEMRTYTLQPGTVATFEERFGQALPASKGIAARRFLAHRSRPAQPGDPRLAL